MSVLEAKRGPAPRLKYERAAWGKVEWLIYAKEPIKGWEGFRPMQLGVDNLQQTYNQYLAGKLAPSLAVGLIGLR